MSFSEITYSLKKYRFNSNEEAGPAENTMDHLTNRQERTLLLQNSQNTGHHTPDEQENSITNSTPPTDARTRRITREKTHTNL
jgi:hypothetical protein